MPTPPKYVVVTGGVISGLGKGVVTASLGTILQAQGYQVSMVKIDPYINIDAGTMRPTEHGEVFVTADGGETDQDIGTYERFLGKDFSKKNNITTGQVYQTVIRRERNLDYDGKCVQVIPHIPMEVERRLKEIGGGADFVIVEVGGTIGDYENILFLEAFRNMHLRGERIAFVHVVYLPVPKNLGEMKTKPAQHSVRMLNEAGIQPTFIIARSEDFIDDVRKEKISTFCNVKPDHIIADPDTDTVYEMPLIFHRQGLTKNLLDFFGLPTKDGLGAWEQFVQKIKSPHHEVKIGIVGKYFDIGSFTLEDSYLSVIEAVKHAAWHHQAKPRIQWLNAKEFEKNPVSLSSLAQYDGIIVPGGFGATGVEGKIAAITYCREQRIPYFGLCYGMQMAVVEFARNVCGLKGAHTTEIDKHAPHPVIDILAEQRKNIEESNYGATMRLGEYPATLKAGTLVHRLYGTQVAKERHRHRYEVNPAYIDRLEKAGLNFSGVSADRKLMEYIELPDHPFFVATQAHPEFTSKALKPNPLYLGFIRACLERRAAPVAIPSHR
ncbi:MAG: CTP synthase [Candidatus Aenigmarchaeota archaeon]|nr:CTP synthase [Candidatus Aenigmarchaeota archaeon]